MYETFKECLVGKKINEPPPKILKLYGNLKSTNFSAANKGYSHIIYFSYYQIRKLI